MTRSTKVLGCLGTVYLVIYSIIKVLVKQAAVVVIFVCDWMVEQDSMCFS